LSLLVSHDTPFGGTAEPTIKNQDEILASLGKQVLSNVR
jgi:hypothetical protein